MSNKESYQERSKKEPDYMQEWAKSELERKKQDDIMGGAAIIIAVVIVYVAYRLIF